MENEGDKEVRKADEMSKTARLSQSMGISAEEMTVFISQIMT